MGKEDNRGDGIVETPAAFAEQIIRKLREADRLLGEGQEVAVVAKQLEVSGQTLQRCGRSTAA